METLVDKTCATVNYIVHPENVDDNNNESDNYSWTKHGQNMQG